MRQITTHHDGHGLAESITIEADDLDPSAGGASHVYVARIKGQEVARVQFQHGPRDEPGSDPGCLDSVLLAFVADRMACFNAGTFPDRTNALVRTKCEEGMHWLRHRADERAARGVLGKNEK